jgi:hypothetical protein
MQNLRVLIVEAELIISKYLSVCLEAKGFDVIGTPLSIDESIEEFRDSEPAPPAPWSASIPGYFCVLPRCRDSFRHVPKAFGSPEMRQ